MCLASAYWFPRSGILIFLFFDLYTSRIPAQFAGTPFHPFFLAVFSRQCLSSFSRSLCPLCAIFTFLLWAFFTVISFSRIPLRQPFLFFSLLFYPTVFTSDTRVILSFCFITFSSCAVLPLRHTSFVVLPSPVIFCDWI